MRRQIWTAFERIVTSDLNKISTEIYKDFQEGFIQELGASGNIFIANGFRCTRVNATTVSVAAGRGYGTVTVGDAEEPAFAAFVRDAAGNMTIATADPTNPRIDLIVVARSVSELTELRDIRTSPSDTITPTNLVKTRRESSQVSVIAGTPNVAPVAPAYNAATQIVLAEVLVTAVTGVGVNGVTDKRRTARMAVSATPPAVDDSIPVITTAGVGSYKSPKEVFESPQGPAELGGRGLLPLGSVVATFPHLTGAYACAATTAADANGFVQCAGQTISDVTSPMNGQIIPNINNSLFVRGNLTSGTAGGAAAVTLTSNELPSHTHTIVNGVVPTAAHTHAIPHTHQSLTGGGAGGSIHAMNIANGADAVGNLSFDAFTTGAVLVGSAVPVQSGSGAQPLVNTLNVKTLVGGARDAAGSAAVSAAPSATQTVSASNTGSGNAFSIIPSYITARYVMRIK